MEVVEGGEMWDTSEALEINLEYREMEDIGLITTDEQEKSKRGRRKAVTSATGKRRLKCSLKSCLPCSYETDCGGCLQCLNKKVMK